MEKISVIVPCYNVEKVVGRCIESILNQTVGIENLELILVNDASTDNTLDVLISYEKKYSNTITIIDLSKNGKQGTARNIGLKYSTGEYIGFIDADDFIDKNMYEVLYNGLTQYDCDFSSCGYVRVDGNSGMPIRLTKDIFYDQVLDISSIEDRKNLLMLNMKNVTCSMLLKRKFLVDNNIEFLENIIYEDNYWGLLVRLYAKKIYICNEKLYKYCFYPDASTISRVNSLCHLDRLKVELIKVDFCKKMDFFELYHDELEAEFLKLFYINTLFILASRFNEFPEGIMGYICKKVKEIFPNFINNKYMNTETRKMLLNCLNMGLDDSEWNVVGKALVEIGDSASI